MDCQGSIEGMGMFRNGSTPASCTGCENLMKEVARRDKLILELQLRLKSINQISVVSSCVELLNNDLGQKFSITCFNKYCPAQHPSSFASASRTPPFSSENESSSGSQDETVQNIMKRKPKMKQHSSRLRMAQQDSDKFAQLGDVHPKIKKITVQEIINKVIESPKRGSFGVLQLDADYEFSKHADKVITVQEIINNAVDKSHKDGSPPETKMETNCDYCDRLLSEKLAYEEMDQFNFVK